MVEFLSSFQHSAENTWEPEDNLDCPELINEFLRNALQLSYENEEEHSEFIPKEEMTEQETEIVSMWGVQGRACLRVQLFSMLFTERLHLDL